MTRQRIFSSRSLMATLALMAAVALALLGVMATSSGAAVGDTTRVSVSSSGAQANYGGDAPSISSNGCLVAFESSSSNLVKGDTNNSWDIFVHNQRTGTTRRVNVSSSGRQANDHSFYPSISSDGRFVAFSTSATNLVKGDTNNRRDIFVRDRQKGITRRVSLSSSEAQANGTSWEPSISSDGRFVAFNSNATNLVRGDSNDRRDLFVRDLKNGTTERVSVSTTGRQVNKWRIDFFTISSDGRFVAFQSEATNLVPGDTNRRTDIFVRDRQMDTTERVSLTSSGEQANGSNFYPSISSDGRFVTFSSMASNLIPGDTNRDWGVFVRDRQENTTERVSLTSSGAKPNGYSAFSSISSDGRFVAFGSEATNLVDDDTNGLPDIFVRDRQMETTQRVSVSSSGAQMNSWGSSFRFDMSSDRRFVAFSSYAPDLVPGDTNREEDVFLHQF